MRLVREPFAHGHWEYAQRVNSNAAVFVLAVTEANELILVEQPRIPLHRRSIELPAGILGDVDAQESPETCALRELEEETGFRGRHARILTEGPVAAGLASEWLYLVRVDGLTRVHQGGGVAGEDITTHLVPLASAPAWLAQQTRAGFAVDPRVYAGLFFARGVADNA